MFDQHVHYFDRPIPEQQQKELTLRAEIYVFLYVGMAFGVFLILVYFYALCRNPDQPEEVAMKQNKPRVLLQKKPITELQILLVPDDKKVDNSTTSLIGHLDIER